MDVNSYPKSTTSEIINSSNSKKVDVDSLILNIIFFLIDSLETVLLSYLRNKYLKNLTSEKHKSSACIDQGLSA